MNVIFPHIKICSAKLQHFFNNVKNNKNIYFDNNHTNHKNYEILKIIQNNIITLKQPKYKQYYNFLIKSIKYSSDILLNKNCIYTLLLSIKNNNNNNITWKICIYKNMMFDLPFTYYDIIYIPFSYLKNSFENNKFTKFSMTLIHEMIHVNQRNNIIYWNNIILKHYKEWILVTNKKIHNFLLNFNFKQKFNIIKVLNPDTDYDFSYLYFYNNNLYYGIFYYNNQNKNISIIWFLFNTKQNIDLIQIPSNFYKTYLPSEEHPYEMFAYKFSELLCN